MARITDRTPPPDDNEVAVVTDDIPEQEPIGPTVRRMAHVVAFGDDLPDEDYQPEVPPPSDIRSAFDMGANLVLPPLPPLETAPFSPPPKPRIRPGPKTRGGRPAGAQELQSLFAAGLIMLISFTLGDWALPTEDEAKDLTAPLGNILARRIDIAAKLGVDANDTIAFTVAIMSYMVRVGPIALERTQHAIAERRRTSPERVVRPRAAAGPTDNSDAGSMASRDAVGVGSGDGETNHSFNALAKARAVAIGSLDRDFGYLPGSDHPVAD